MYSKLFAMRNDSHLKGSLVNYIAQKIRNTQYKLICIFE